LRRINVAAEAGPILFSVAQPLQRAARRFIMQIQSKALPQSFSLRRSIQGFSAASDGSHPMLVFAVVVLLALLAIIQIDLHSAQLQAMGLLGQAATGIDPVFLSP
jgi:hypothetical protein